MKLIALLGAGALAAGTIVTAAPANVQNGYHRGYGYDHDRGYDRDRGNYHDRGHGYDRDRGYERYEHRGYERRGYHGGYGYARPRVVCRVHRGYYHPVRRCFRVYR